MEKIKINLNDKVSGIKFLNINTIENYDNNYRLSLNTSISEVKEGQIVEYIRESCVSLTKGKTYEVLSIEEGWYRIVDDTDEDYLFSPDEFRIVEK